MSTSLDQEKHSLKGKENQLPSNINCHSVLNVDKEKKNEDGLESVTLALKIGIKEKDARMKHSINATQEKAQNGDFFPIKNSIPYSEEEGIKTLHQKRTKNEHVTQLPEVVDDVSTDSFDNKNNFLLSEKCRSFDSIKKWTQSLFYSEGLKNDGHKDGCTPKIIYDVCEMESPKDILFDAIQMCFSTNYGTGNEFVQESENGSSHPEVRSCNISFKSEERQNAINHLETTAEISLFPSMNFDRMENESAHPEIRNCDISFQSGGHNFPKESIRSMPKYEVSAACQMEAPSDISKVPHVDVENLLCDILRNGSSSNYKNLEEFAQESKEGIKVKSIAIQTELFTENHITTPRDPAIACAENENLISLIMKFFLISFRIMYQSLSHILAQINNTISNARTNNELRVDITENGSTAANVESVLLSERETTNDGVYLNDSINSSNSNLHAEICSKIDEGLIKYQEFLKNYTSYFTCPRCNEFNEDLVQRQNENFISLTHTFRLMSQSLSHILAQINSTISNARTNIELRADITENGSTAANVESVFLSEKETTNDGVYLNESINIEILKEATGKEFAFSTNTISLENKQPDSFSIEERDKPYNFWLAESIRVKNFSPFFINNENVIHRQEDRTDVSPNSGSALLNNVASNENVTAIFKEVKSFANDSSSANSNYANRRIGQIFQNGLKKCKEKRRSKIKSRNIVLRPACFENNSNCKTLLEERNNADSKAGQEILKCQMQRDDSSTLMKGDFNFRNIGTPSFFSQKPFNEDKRNVNILTTTHIEDGTISQAKHCEETNLSLSGVIQTKESFISDQSPSNNYALFNPSQEDQAQCINTQLNRSTAKTFPSTESSNFIVREGLTKRVTGEKFGLPGVAFSKVEGAVGVMDGKEKLDYHADDNAKISSSQTNQIVSRKRKSLKKGSDITQSNASFSSWRAKENGSSDSEDSCSDIEPSTVSERTSNSPMLLNQQKQKATMQWLDEKCIISDMLKHEQDNKCAEFLSKPGQFHLAADESNLCLTFDNLKLDILNNPSFVNLELTSKRGGNNLAETHIKRTYVLPGAVKGKVVKTGKPRDMHNKPEFKVEQGEMQSSVMHQSQRKHHPNQSTPNKGMKQNGIETAHQSDSERIFSNNQKATSFQSNGPQCLPSTSMRKPFPERSNTTEIEKLNPNYESENRQLSNNDAIDIHSPGSFTIRGSPASLDQENRDLSAIGELSNSVESLVDSLNSFHFSDDRKLVTKNENEEFSFQTKNFKMTFQSNSNLDNVKLCYERCSSKAELEFKNHEKKLILEIENN